MLSPLIGSCGTGPGPVGRRSTEGRGLEGGKCAWLRWGFRVVVEVAAGIGRMTSGLVFVVVVVMLLCRLAPVFLFGAFEVDPVAFELTL